MSLENIHSEVQSKLQAKYGGVNLTKSKKTDVEKARELSIWIANLLDKKGGMNIRILETNPGTFTSDFLIVATGTSSRHMQSLLDYPCEELKKLGYPALRLEGEGTHWLLADLGDIVIHIFDEQTRNYYDLDGLWQNAPRIEWEAPSKLGVRRS